MSDKAGNIRKWWILIAMGAILGVILLDETVVGVALPTIQTDLGMSEVASHWVVNIYMLVLACLAAAAGKLGDIVGHKTLMIAGLLIFGLASLMSGFAESGFWLIAARGTQGLGAAIIFPSSLAMVTIAFPVEQRGMAMGIYGAVGTTFLALGPAVGGFLTEFASWRWIFWVNPPIVLLIAAVVLFAWRDPQSQGKGERVDKTGLILLVGGLSLMVFATMQAPEWGWSDPTTVVLGLAGLVLLVRFVLVERRTFKPLIKVDLFANPTFTGCNLVVFLAQYSKMAVFVFGALYLQDVLGMTSLMAGLALLPTVAPQIITAPIAGIVADRYGARWPSLAGLALMTFGPAWIWLAIDADNYWYLFPGLLAWGLSPAFLFVPPQRAVMNAVPVAKQGQAGGIIMSSQLLGATVGMSVCSAVFSTTNDYQAVFLGNTIVSLGVLVIGWFTIERIGKPPLTAPLTNRR